MLRGVSFPVNNGYQCNRLPPAGKAPERITEQLVERAQFSQSVKKAPGQDSLSFGAIFLIWKWNKTAIIGLRKSAVRMECDTTVWMGASGVVIRKLQKQNYTKLKSY